MVEPSGDETLLTYVELAERLGCAPDTARLRAKRRGWRIEHGNDGKARVRVPSGMLPDVPPERPRRDADDLPTVGELLAELGEARDDAAAARREAEVANVRLGTVFRTGRGGSRRRRGGRRSAGPGSPGRAGPGAGPAACWRATTRNRARPRTAPCRARSRATRRPPGCRAGCRP